VKVPNHGGTTVDATCFYGDMCLLNINDYEYNNCAI